jgi:hypothetical protein
MLAARNAGSRLPAIVIVKVAAALAAYTSGSPGWT